MVSLNALLITVAAVVVAAPGVLANTIQLAADVPDIIIYDAPTRRSIGDKFGKRITEGGVDPYAGYTCAPWYPLNPVPENPNCWENNCYRGFINGRQGQEAFHCPSVAFDYCCQWYSLNANDKDYIVRNGVFYFFLPWSSFCGAAGPFSSDAQVNDAITYIDDTCACTLQHKVRVTLPDDYAALNPLSVSDPTCAQHF
ncbi:hypothetical protein V8F06_001985 [Rhypophila decipiens]